MKDMADKKLLKTGLIGSAVTPVSHALARQNR